MRASRLYDRHMSTAPVNALVTKQWRSSWDAIDWPEHTVDGLPVASAFLTFVLSAASLRALSGVYPRDPDKNRVRSRDQSIQRPHDEGRSREISRFVDYGYPISGMRGDPERQDLTLRRPGWLPTAIVINILAPGEVRDGKKPLSPENAVAVPDLEDLEPGGVTQFEMPPTWTGSSWQTDETPPFEVIDGQHRLWAFDSDSDTREFQLPVVAFVNLPRSFQAYLFWTINIKPRRINTSLAFDLYPMLRSEDWLMQGEGAKVYRESRAQELTEALWSAPSSPWFDRINMIGATKVRASQPVTQNSFVRSLLSSFVKPWDGRRSIAGGLFGNIDNGGLEWTRGQQAAFLVAGWEATYKELAERPPEWLLSLPALEEAVPGLEAGMHDPFGRFSILGSDQGVRAFSQVLNDLAHRSAFELNLRSWRREPLGDVVDPEEVESALLELKNQSFYAFVLSFAQAISQFDWRSAATPGLSEYEALQKSAYKGSGGYVALRRDIFRAMAATNQSTLLADESAKISALLAEVDDDID